MTEVTCRVVITSGGRSPCSLFCSRSTQCNAEIAHRLDMKRPQAAILSEDRFGGRTVCGRRIVQGIRAVGLVVLVSTVTACSNDRLAWPVDGGRRELWHSYGQLQESTAGTTRYHHEGIDIPAPAGTPVRFHGRGEVVDFDAVDPSPYQRELKIREGSRTWIYRHMQPRAGTQIGQRIAPGTVVGTINPATPGAQHLDDHLHVGVVIAGELDDPLLHLRERTAKRDAPRVVEVAFLRRPANTWLRTSTCTGAVVLQGDVDIVAKIEDGFPSAGTSIVGISQVGFQVMKGTLSEISELSFRFAQGDRSIKQTESDAASRLVPVVFSFGPAPAVSDDIDRRPALTNSRHLLWYALTNIGEDRFTIAPADEGRFWNTAVKNPLEWNRPMSVAADNARARFPDDPYQVVAWARDVKPQRSERPQNVFLNNFDEVLEVGTAQGVVQQQFANQEVYIFGHGYPPNRDFWVYVLPAPGLPDCGPLPAFPRMRVRSNALGRIVPVRLAGAQPNIASVVVLDYDGDDKQTNPREGRTVDPRSGAFLVPAG
jgi:hypothetical protein